MVADGRRCEMRDARCEEKEEEEEEEEERERERERSRAVPYPPSVHHHLVQKVLVSTLRLPKHSLPV